MSVFLAILVGRSCVCIDSIQTQGVIVGYSPLSQPIPLHALHRVYATAILQMYRLSDYIAVR